MGEILWDVFPDGERLGGAALNFAAHATCLGHEVAFVSAVGDDRRGELARKAMTGLGLSTELVGAVREAPTGIVTVAVDRDGQPSFTIHRPAAYDLLRLDDEQLQRLAASKPDWVYYGTLFAMHPGARSILARILDACPSAGRFYDVNLRRDSFRPDLVRELAGKATVVKLNDEEMAVVAGMLGVEGRDTERFCREACARLGWRAVCVTRGARGSALLAGGTFVEAEGYPVRVVDTVGSGDAFAAAFLHGMGLGWGAAKTADFANRVGALAATRAGGAFHWTIGECLALARNG